MPRNKADLVGSRYTYDADVWDLAGLPREGRLPKDVMDDIADFVHERILDKVGGARSPIKGQGRFKALSDDYAERKRDFTSSVKPNLELEGDMLDNFKAKSNARDQFVELYLTGREALKAENHNEGVTLPRRPFLPHKRGEQFSDDIRTGVRRIIKQHLESQGDGE